VGSLKPIENTQLPTYTHACKTPAAYLYLICSTSRVPTAFTPAYLSASLPSLPTLPRHPSSCSPASKRYTYTASLRTLQYSHPLPFCSLDAASAAHYS
jgi:hypothetical protein